MSMTEIPFSSPPTYPDKELMERASRFYLFMDMRRSVRHFSDRSIPEEAVKNCIRTAGTAPSGANQQPWTFVLVKDPRVKRRIREEAERVERSFYEETAPGEWKSALKLLGTGYRKPFLEKAPYLIVIFVQKYGHLDNGTRVTHYYAQKSVGIATGFLVTALHQLGISTLTYTPSHMGFLNTILERPKNELPYLVLVAGYADVGARVPDISRKSFDEIAVIV
jgi:nitroreductase